MISTRDLVSPLDTRTTIIGRNGTGKTRLAESLLEFYKNVIVLDIKGLIRWPDYKIFSTFKDFRNSQAYKKIYKPNISEMRNAALIEEFFYHVYDRGNTVIYVDEVYAVTVNGQIDDGYHAVLTRGRERGITVYQSTQRPVKIAQEVLSEAEQFMSFALNLEQDRKRVEEVSGIPEELIADLEKFDFYYANQDGVYGPYRLDLTNNATDEK